MAYNSNPPRAEYTSAAGQTVFPFVFKIFQDTDIKGWLTPLGDSPDDLQDLLVLGIDYTVTINGDAGGDFTLLSAGSLGDSVTLARELPIVRDIDYQTGGDALADTFDLDQDYQTYLVADNAAVSERALVIAASAQGVDTTVPAPVSLNFLQWNSGATALINVYSLQADGFLWTAADVYTKTEIDDTVVKLTGNQTIAGIKTFSDSPIAPTPTPGDSSTKVATTEFVGANSLNTSSEAQTKTGDLSIGESITVASWSYSGTAITINTAADHNLIIGQYFSIDGLVATTNAPNGRWQVATVPDSDTITFTAVDVPTGAATVSSASLKHGDIEAKGVFIGKNACTAYVNFDNSVTPPTIRESFNVYDVERVSGNIARIHFQEPMDTTTYTPSGIAGFDASNAFRDIGWRVQTVDYIEIETFFSTTSSAASNAAITIHGGKN